MSAASAQDKDIYRQQGFGARSGVGQRPMLLIVDFVESFADPQMFGGGNISRGYYGNHAAVGFRAQPVLAGCDDAHRIRG